MGKNNEQIQLIGAHRRQLMEAFDVLVKHEIESVTDADDAASAFNYFWDLANKEIDKLLAEEDSDGRALWQP